MASKRSFSFCRIFFIIKVVKQVSALFNMFYHCCIHAWMRVYWETFIILVTKYTSFFNLLLCMQTIPHLGIILTWKNHIGQFFWLNCHSFLLHISALYLFRKKTRIITIPFLENKLVIIMKMFLKHDLLLYLYNYMAHTCMHTFAWTPTGLQCRL